MYKLALGLIIKSIFLLSWDRPDAPENYIGIRYSASQSKPFRAIVFYDTGSVANLSDYRIFLIDDLKISKCDLIFLSEVINKYSPHGGVPAFSNQTIIDVNVFGRKQTLYLNDTSTVSKIFVESESYFENKKESEAVAVALATYSKQIGLKRSETRKRASSGSGH
jgi:hypothetical protein